MKLLKDVGLTQPLPSLLHDSSTQHINYCEHTASMYLHAAFTDICTHIHGAHTLYIPIIIIISFFFYLLHLYLYIVSIITIYLRYPLSWSYLSTVVTVIILTH